MKKAILIFSIIILSAVFSFAQKPKILGRYYESGFYSKYWYLGIISETDNGRYYVIHDDGYAKWYDNRKAIVPFKTVAQTGVNEGDRVLARYYDSGNSSKYWYMATVETVDGERVYVRYDDGDVKWHTDMNTIVKFKTL